MSLVFRIVLCYIFLLRIPLPPNIWMPYSWISFPFWFLFVMVLGLNPAGILSNWIAPLQSGQVNLRRTCWQPVHQCSELEHSKTLLGPLPAVFTPLSKPIRLSSAGRTGAMRQVGQVWSSITHTDTVFAQVSLFATSVSPTPHLRNSGIDRS